MQSGELPLRAFLATTITPILADPRTREIVINEPGRIGVERAGTGWEWHDAPDLTLDRIDQISILAGWLLSKDVDESHPICMTRLPDGQRYTIVRSPAVEKGLVSVTIRNPSVSTRTVWEDDFTDIMSIANQPDRQQPEDDELLDLYQKKRWPAFTSLAVKARKTMVATGATHSGKTTLVKTLMQELAVDERLITIEDTPEFGPLPPKNRVSLIYGSAGVTAEDCVEASLRMRPDRIAMQELRGSEAFAYMRALAAGHPGGFTTWHADDGDHFTPLALMVKTSVYGQHIPDDKLMLILRRLIDIVMFCKRDHKTGRFGVPSVWFRQAENEGITS